MGDGTRTRPSTLARSCAAADTSPTGCVAAGEGIEPPSPTLRRVSCRLDDPAPRRTFQPCARSGWRGPYGREWAVDRAGDATPVAESPTRCPLLSGHRAAAGTRTPSCWVEASRLTGSASAAWAPPVRVAGFEPATFCSQGRRAAKLPHTREGRAARRPCAEAPRGQTGNRTLNSCLQGRRDPVSPSARGRARRGPPRRERAHGPCPPRPRDGEAVFQRIFIPLFNCRKCIPALCPRAWTDIRMGGGIRTRIHRLRRPLAAAGAHTYRFTRFSEPPPERRSRPSGGLPGRLPCR